MDAPARDDFVDMPQTLPGTPIDIRVALIEERQRVHTKQIWDTTQTLKDIRSWQLALQGQLSVWRWMAPLIASIISSIITAYLIRSIIP